MENTYIHDIDQIWSENGEVYITSEDKTVTFDAKNILSNLDSLLYFAIKEVNQENKDLQKRIEETIKKLKY
tara:strand:- start:2389 stop:2601 length:213 start_codon:yes stop_codon:yes gene_type:complete